MIIEWFTDGINCGTLNICRYTRRKRNDQCFIFRVL